MQPLGVGAGANAIVQGLIGNLFSIQLALGVFMSVQAQLGIVGKVGTELQEERTETFVDTVEIVVVHQRSRFDDPGIAGVFLGIVPFLGAVNSAFLLCLANENDALAVGVLRPQSGGDIIFALPFSKVIRGI